MLKNTEAGTYSKYIVQDLQYPELGTPDFKEMYNKFAKRILWIDGNVVPGAFQMNTAWYCKAPERDPVFPGHVHAEDELIGFFSGDPENPYELGAEIEIEIDGEKRRLTRSSLVFIPGNVPHMPMRILRVDRPVFHFSIIMGREYIGGAYN